MNLKREPSYRAYFLAVLLIALATPLTYWSSHLRQLHSMALYMIAVVITAYYGGFLPSLVAIVLSSICFDLFFAPPFGFGMSDPQDKVRLAMFIAIASLVCFLQAQRMKAEEKFRTVARRLSLALEGTKLGVWDLDLATGVMWHSPSLEETVGRCAERFAQSYEVFLGYVHSEDRDFVHRTVTRSIENGEEYHIQYRVTLPSGELRWVGTRGKVFFNARRHPQRLVAVTSDLTNQPGPARPPAAPSPAFGPDFPRMLA